MTDLTRDIRSESGKIILKNTNESHKFVSLDNLESIVSKFLPGLYSGDIVLDPGSTSLYFSDIDKKRIIDLINYIRDFGKFDE